MFLTFLSPLHPFEFFSLQSKTGSWFCHRWFWKRGYEKLQALPSIYQEHGPNIRHIAPFHSSWRHSVQQQSLQDIWIQSVRK